MKAALTQNASQRLILSRDVTQKLAILQTPTVDLQALAEREAELNPVLEVEETRAENTTGVEAEEETSPWENHLFSQMDWMPARQPSTSLDEERHRFMMDSLTRPVTLTEHIALQLGALEVSDSQMEAVRALLACLNDSGWLNQSLLDIAEAEKIPLHRLKEAQRMLLELDPPGIGAQDLRECLMVQLERLGNENGVEYRMLRDCFDLLAKRRFEDIADRLGVSVEEVFEASHNITSLNPRPAAAFQQASLEPLSVTPELTIEKQDGEWVVVTHKEYTPGVRISNYYKNLMTSESTPPEVKSYIRDQVKRGRFFISCLEQRRQTIQKIAECIVRHQREFLEKGPGALKPLRMGEIAAKVEMHASTISRTVCGKYAETPHGVFELRTFFTSGVETEDGGAVSGQVLKARLKQLIENENPAMPYTDDQLVAIFAEQGVSLVRRTIVKYRASLGILASAMRRREPARQRA